MLTLIILCSIGSGNVWGTVSGSIATSISAGDQIVIVNTGEANELTGVTSNIGQQASYTTAPAGTYILTVEAGKSGSGYSFKDGSNKYLAYTLESGTKKNNNLYLISSPSTATQNQQCSWTVSINGTTKEATITNVYNTQRSLKFNSDRFCCYTSAQTAIKIFKIAASTPTITPSVTELDWGTVNKGASLTTKTFTITGTNLTSAALVYAATGGGYTVSPSGKAGAAGTLASQTITVTPPSTATPGTYNYAVTVSGGGLSTPVSVAVKLTVQQTDVFIDDVHSSTGYEPATPHIEGGAYGTTPTLTDKATLTSGTCEQVHYHFVGWITSAKYEAGTTIAVGDLQTPTSATGATYYAVWAKQAAGGGGTTTESYGWETADDDSNWIISGVSKYDTYKKTGSYSGKIARGSTGESAVQFKNKVNVTSFSFQFLRQTTNNNYNVRIETSSNGSSWDDVENYNMSEFSSAETWYAKSHTFDGKTALYVRFVCYTTTAVRWVDDISITYSGGVSYEDYIAKCCDDPGLAYGTGSVTKTYGDPAFTNTLTNSHSVGVTYALSSVSPAGCVSINSSNGQVTINGAGSATVTASFAGNATYCADEASYTLTVNKANISPTLTYDPAAVTVGSTLTSFTLSGNSGSGTVTYVSSNDAIATVNSSGVVTGVAPGTVTIIATIAATTNYNGNTATSNTITVNAAACTGVNSLHTGNKDQGGWVTNQCFEDADWGAADDAIYVGAFPLTNECYVGWAGGNSYYGAYWAVGGIKTYDIPTGRTLGWNSGNYYESYPGGALGTFHIYKNSKDENYYLRFKPSSYILRTGSNETSWTSREMTVSATNSHYYETAELDLTSTLISEHAYVDLKTNGGDGHVWCNFSNDRTASGNVKVKSSVGDADGNFRGDNLKASDNGTHGKFRIDITKDVDNWKLAFVPMYRITYAAGTGASGSMDPSSYAEISTTIAAAANGFTAPTGKQFNGWSDGVNSYAAGANVTMNSNVTLTAQWTDIDYTVTVSQSPDVSATTTGQTTTAHYGGTINLTTTIPSGYRFVNWTTSDGFSITNPTSATTASFTMPNKSVTVTANFQQTHTVDWYVGGSAPANKIGDDGQTTVVDHGGKIEDFPNTTPDGSPCDKTFVGWTNTSSYVHGTSPLFNDVAGSPTINADANFYAVFATGGATEYVLTPAASLSAGRYVIAAYDDSNSKFVALTGAVSAVSTGSNSDMVNETTGFTISEGKFTSLPTGACEFVLTAYTGETDEGFYIQNPADDKYLDYQDGASGTNRRLWYYEAADYEDQYGNPTTPFAAWYGVALSKDGFPDNGMYLKYVDGSYSLMSNGSGTSFVRGYANDNTKYKPIYLFKKTGGLSGYTITCADCGTSVTPTYTAAPTGGTVSVTKSATPVSSGSTVKTCTSVDLTVTITPASHYTLTGFTATGLSTGTATISPAVGSTLPKTTETTFTVTVSAGATGTLNLTPTFTEDTKVAITWNVNGVNQSIAATEGLTWVYSGEDLTALPSTPSVPAGCTGTKVFAGWSQKHSDATEQDAAWYDDLFDAYNDPTVPTGITSAKTFYAVFATSSSNPLAGEVMWDEPWTGTSDKTAPTSPSSGATVYNSTVLTYAYTDGNTTTQVYAEGTMYSGGAAAPELLISKTSPSGVWTVTNIPTGGSAQTELTLSYKTNRTTIEVTSGTSGITIGDPTVDGNTYTHTITINHSPSTINNFSLIFTNTGSSNARLDDIHLVVPGSGTMTDYVTLCAPSYTITYNKNTEDAVTNLPSPTSVLQSTGSGTLSSTVPERATYTFTGWSETTSGAVAYAAGGSITGVTGDKTLYAVWAKTPVEELTLNYSELNKYVGDPAVTLEVTGVTPEGADPSVTWSSSNSSVASVVAATGVVTFGTVGTATITATSTVTGTTTAYCYVTVRNKPTASFTDLIHDGNGTDLSTYHMQNVAGTEIVFPTLDDYATPGDDCDSKHYIFVGWTTSDNNDDPEDHLVASGELEDDQDKVFYAVWADGEEGVSYTQLTTSTFKTSPTKYVIGAIDGDDTFYFNSCAATDANNGNGGCTNAPGTNAPIEFTLSGTAGALVATSTEATARYLTPLTAKNFQMSATSKTIQLNADGTIANPSDESWTLRFNTSEDYLRWYSSATGNAAYFYEVTSGAAVSYRTSCCTNNVLAPTVIATNTAYTVTLTWAAVDGATGYEVSWNGGAFTAATSPCVKSGLTASTDYIYKVRATYDPLVKCGALVASGSVTTDDVYSVTYSGGTGTGSCSPSGSVAPASYEAGATVTLAPTNSFSLTSNTFAAWVVKDADDNDVPVSNNQFTMPAKNVTVTATWTPVQDKYYDRMHDGTDGSHGGVQDGEGKYYLVLEGCNYTVPTLTDDDDGDTDCHTTHYKLLGWIAQSHLKTDGSGQIKPDEESYIFQGGGTKSATGATYYAIWAIMTE